jgi:hypothetical protein
LDRRKHFAMSPLLFASDRYGEQGRTSNRYA